MHSMLRLLFTLAVVTNGANPAAAEAVHHSYSATSVAVSPDGRRLAAGLTALPIESAQAPQGVAQVRLTDTQSGREIRTLYLPVDECDVVRSIAFSPDGTLIAWGGRGRVFLFSVESGRRVAILKGHASNFDSVTFSPHGHYLAGSSARTQIELWSLKLSDSPETAIVESTPFGSSSQPVAAVSFWPGSIHTVRSESSAPAPVSEAIDEPIVAAAAGRELRFWNARTGEGLESDRQLFEGLVRDVAWSDDGSLLVVCGDGFVSVRNGFSLRDLPLGAEIRQIAIPEDSRRSFFQVGLGHDSRTLAASDASAVYVWETGLHAKQTGRLLGTIPATGRARELLEWPAGRTRPVFAFSPNSPRIFVTLAAGVGIFDPNTGNALDWATPPETQGRTEGAAAAEPQPRRDQYLLRQIQGLLEESAGLEAQGRRAEAKQHREKAAWRAQQLAEHLRESPVPEPESNDLIENGSFERALVGEPPRNIQTLQPGSNAIAGWTTFDPQIPLDNGQREQDRGAQPRIVDWIGPDRWKAAHGNCCLDIDGGIAQTVATGVGGTYALTFDMAGNPEFDRPVEQLLHVRIADETYEFRFHSADSTTHNLRWNHRIVVFEAASARTTIRLVNAQPNVHSAGVAIDRVALRKLDANIAERTHELFSRGLRFEREAAGLKAAGRLEESAQHAAAAARYFQQLRELVQPAKS